MIMQVLKSNGGNMKKFVLLVSVLSLFALSLSSKTLIPVNIDKGEMFDDNTEKVEV